MENQKDEKPEGTENESQELPSEDGTAEEPNQEPSGEQNQEAPDGSGGEGQEGSDEDLTKKEDPPKDPAKGKPGPKPKADGFRAECYKKIEKGITSKTVMKVIKLRHRLGTGLCVTPGDTFKAAEMDARVIKSAMDRYWIVPEKDAPDPDEKRAAWFYRMAQKYEGEGATRLPGCKAK